MFGEKSIAVLPFDNLSAEAENEYFADGMTEEIINALARIPQLKVTARTSSFAFKGRKEDVRIIGNELGVNTVLEGSIRKSGSRVRISTQLIRTDTGFQLWSESFDRQLEDIFALQDELSLLIADKIRENFGHLEISEHLVRGQRPSLPAYELFLKASYYFKRKDFDDIQLAGKLFQKVIALDPSYAEAYAYLAELQLHLGGFNILSAEEAHKKAAEYADQALAVNEKEPRAYKVKAYISLFYDWHWESAIQHYNQAIACGLPQDNEFVSYYYTFIQRDYRKAIAVAREAAARDPLHVMSHFQLGICYFFARQLKEALEAFEESLRLDAGFGESLRWKALCLAHLGDIDQAFIYVQQALDATQGQGLARIDRISIQILAGQREEALKAMQGMEFLDPCDPAQLYSLLNMPEEAIANLEEGIHARSVMMVTLKHYWIWDNIREAPGFKDIYARMRFDQVKPHKAQPGTHQLVEAQQKLSDEEQEAVLGALEAKMQEPELVEDHELSLRSLAEVLELHPNRLSWVLNERLGKNFNEYVNGFRLKAFQQKALDPAYAHLSILGLAYESGFSSKSVFNDFFKKKTGITPKAWQKAQRS